MYIYTYICMYVYIVRDNVCAKKGKFWCWDQMQTRTRFDTSCIFIGCCIRQGVNGIYAHTHTHTQKYIHTHTYARPHTYTHTHTHTHTHTRTHTHTQGVNGVNVPMMSKEMFLHTRSEFLGIFPSSPSLKTAVQVFGNSVDHGAKDIFRCWYLFAAQKTNKKLACANI